MAEGELTKTVARRRKIEEASCDIDDRDGTVDHNQQDIDDSGVGNEAG